MFATHDWRPKQKGSFGCVWGYGHGGKCGAQGRESEHEKLHAVKAARKRRKNRSKIPYFLGAYVTKP